jgi:hypothetical protein
VSAAPSLSPIEPTLAQPRIIAFPGTALSLREAATALGVAESTLRRQLKNASAAQSSETQLTCDYRGRQFVATRKAVRTPWQIQFAGDTPPPVAPLGYDELRVAMLPMAQERALEHTPERPWWKLWVRRRSIFPRK